IVEGGVEVDQPAAATRAAGVGGLPEERVANAVGDGQVGPNAPGVLAVILKLVVENIRRNVERSLGERIVLAEQEVGVRLLEVEGASAARCGRTGANRAGGGSGGRVLRIEIERS